jgi:3-oxoacyl-[acyl-carrier protein] reductase
MVSTVDVGDWNQVSEVPDKVLNQFGAIDILVNNAGIAIYKSFLEMSNQDWERVIDTNLVGVLRCCKAVLPAMLQARKGVIVNVASTAGLHGVPNLSIYSASKFALIGFTQSLAAETIDQGVKVYAICPGPTYTDLHRSIVGDEAALSAQPPEKVAEKTLAVVLGETRLPSGGEIVVDAPAISSAGIKSRRAWINRARRALKELCSSGWR